ncbi:PEP-utilizing enzyme [Thermosporothrix hazakensis]|jgi:pyruvate,water dikinase|nr:PEP-utilizing enzyme [Thermosporothrix hazakensis]BBH86860.1 hypothetical protein KTC_16110 [Thermosporothrix sp. COM3]
MLLTNKLLKGLATADELQQVMRSLPLNVTTEMDLTLWTLAQKFARDNEIRQLLLHESSARLAQRYHEGTLPHLVQSELQTFLHQYGQRGIAEIDAGLPRWSEKPEPIFDILANFLGHTQPEQAPDIQFKRGTREAEEKIRTLIRRARHKSWLRGKAVAFALHRMRLLLGLRELPKFTIVSLLAFARAQLWPIGRELAAIHHLETPEDIFFLTLPEVHEALAGKDFREQVRERRATYAFELRRKHVPRVLLSDGTEPEARSIPPDAQGTITLHGIAASPGHLTGTARVILDPTNARLEQGEILVAPSTDPGWTPLFLTAGALVMEMGGPMSHGAVVAREYGIPAVVGVPGATETIATGQTITVDGFTGTVSITPES